MRFWIYDLRLTIDAGLVVVATLLICPIPAGRAQNPVSAANASTNDVYLVDLPTVLQLAGAQNLDIKIAREKLAAAKADQESALTQFFPWIAPGVSYRRHDNLIQDVAGNIVDVHKQSYTAGGIITAQLELGDAVYKTLVTRQLVKAADHGLEAQQRDTILGAAQGYFDVAKSQAAVSVAREALRISRDYEQQLGEAVKAGLAFKGDLLRAKVQADRNQMALRQAQEQQRAASARLAQLVRLDSIVELVAREMDLAPLSLVATNLGLEALVRQAMTSRAELRQSQALVTAAKKGRDGAVYGPLIPSLGAQVFLGGLGGGKNDGAGTFGESEDYVATLSWRIGPGGLFDRSRVQAAESRFRSAGLGEEKLRDDILRQVVESHTRVHSQADQIATAKQALAAAEESLKLTRGRKEYAVGIVLENILAEQELTRVRLEYLNAVAEFNKAQYGLSRAIGALAVPGAKESGK